MEIDVKGRERELTSKLNHIKSGKERLRLLGIQSGENLHVIRGERHVRAVFVFALL